MNYRQTYSKLYATSLDPEQHERTAGYWYTVTNGATAHTAFTTRAGLDRWLCERGLSLENDLPASGTWGTTRIPGEYRHESHGTFVNPEDYTIGMTEDEDWKTLRPVLATAVMSNGEYTLALITETDGIRTVHTLNVNVKTRVIFDSTHTRQWLES